jgi:predicted outer membrane repeat protein
MKINLIKNKTFFLFILIIMLILICCYDFEIINQPTSANPNSTFDVPITVSVSPDGGAEDRDRIPYFGILLPVGWSVSDSITYEGIHRGKFIYSAAMSELMEVVDSSPDGYYWWVSVGDSLDSPHDGTVSFTPQIQTDDQSGLFYIDYMLGDDDNGINYVRSDNHLISVGMPVSVTVTNTNDSGEGSLRQAISDVSNGGEILFDLSYPTTIVLDSQLVLDRFVTITGPESGQLIVSGNNQARVLYINEYLNINISNLTIAGGNVSDGSSGGGISCSNSYLSLEDVIITDNMINEGNGGGIYCEESEIRLKNVKITGNSVTTGQLNANLSAGGNGGGIFCSSSNLSFFGVTIANNLAGNVGGGITFFDHSTILFDSEARSDIYFNKAVLGNDLYNDNNSMINVVLDTFTVLFPSSYYAYPGNFNFDILNAKIINYDADLYVSSDGDNNNSGTSPSEALQSISSAVTKIAADTLNPHTIYIDNGIYSTSANGEDFPLRIPNYVTLSGANIDSVILDAGNNACIVEIFLDDHVWDTTPPERYKQMIQCWESILKLNNVTITNNSSGEGVQGYGGGITCEHSILNLTNLTLSNNATEHNGGGIMSDASQVDISFAKIFNNSAGNQGGGIFCSSSDLIVTSVVSAKNKAVRGGGIYYQNSKAILTNVTVTDNRSTEYGGGICSDDEGYSQVMNSILWNNSPESIYPEGLGTVVYSDIQGISSEEYEYNIDVDPIFADTIHFYLSEDSPCIDAGDPDTYFNDREDINNPGFALWPAFGTLHNDMGAYGGHGEYIIVVEIKDDDVGHSQLPTQFRLFQNYPNPFNPSTTIEFSLPKSEFVLLKVYNILGKEVATLVSNKLNQGNHTYTFNGNNLASGIYYYQLMAGDYREVKKMILLR